MKKAFTRVASAFLFAALTCFSGSLAAQCLDCADNCVIVNVTEGGFAAEVGWSITDAAGVEVVAGGAPTLDLELCLPTGCYSFNMTDTFGDGWNDAVYTLTDDLGIVIQSGDIDTADAGDGASIGSDVLAIGGATGCVVAGCTLPGACNFDETANTDDGSCEFLTCAGCTDPTACNFDEANTIEDGSCDFSCLGCTDDTAVNYDPTATIDDGSCLDCTSTFAEVSMTDTFGDGWSGATYAVFDATSGAVIATGDLNNAQTGDQLTFGSDFFCIEDNACYTFSVTADDFPGEVAWSLLIGGTELLSGGADENINFFIGAPATACGFEGCTDPTATNFDAFADTDDGSCVFPPDNDLCDNSVLIACGSSTNGTMLNATITGEETLTCNGTDVTSPGVWYRLVGDGSQITAETCNSLAGDTKIHVFEGDCATPVCVGANDDTCGLLSSFTWPSTDGTTYYILVSEFGAGTGADFVLDVSCIECTDAIDNDDCVDATTVFSGDALNQSLCCAAAGDATPCLSAFATNYDRWYVFNSASFDSFEFFVTNAETGGNTSVGFTLWEDAGTGCVDMTALICCPLVTGQCGGTSGDLGIAIIPDNDYYLQVYTLDPAGCGDFEISLVGNILGCTDDTACNYNMDATEDDGSCVFVGPGPDEIPGTEDDCIVLPANDACGDAVVVACGDAVVGSTGGATAGDAPGTVVDCEGAPGAGVWYTHVGTEEFVTIDFCGSTIDASINVYASSSDCAGTFSCVEFDAGDLDNCGFFDQDDPFVTFASELGVNYYIYVSSEGAAGEFSFNVNCEPIVEGCTTEGACNYDATANIDDGSCDFFSCVCPDATGTPILFDMVDTFGDGWNGATYTITNGADGAVIASGDLDNALSGDGVSAGFDVVCLPALEGCFTVTVGGGTFDGEIQWTASIEDGTVLATGFANVDAPDVIILGGAVCGCTDAGACNFDDLATSDDGSCEFLTCAGCTDDAACNFDPTATIDANDTCCFENCVTLNLTDSFGDGWNGATYTITENGSDVVVATGDIDTAVDGDGASAATVTLCLPDGCYNIVAGGGTFDGEIGWSLFGVLDVDGNPGSLAGGDTDPEGDGDEPVIFGVGTACVVACNTSIACNYVEVVDIADCNLCDFDCEGCTYEDAMNFDATAGIDDGSCEFMLGSDCPADINGDGTIDGGDLLAFLGAFGGDCP